MGQSQTLGSRSPLMFQLYVSKEREQSPFNHHACLSLKTISRVQEKACRDCMIRAPWKKGQDGGSRRTEFDTHMLRHGGESNHNSGK
ncbi:hypothetical protein VUR80DRAFT_499 [Thermomyces stellatus]